MLAPDLAVDMELVQQWVVGAVGFCTDIKPVSCVGGSQDSHSHDAKDISVLT